MTDLANSTALVHDLGDARHSDLIAAHDSVARDLIESHNGLEIDRTDGFFVSFDRPLNAVGWALDFHETLDDISNFFGVEIRCRVGIHLGEVFLRKSKPEEIEKGASPFVASGLAVSVCSRITCLSQPGQTLISRAAFDLARRSAFGGEIFSARPRGPSQMRSKPAFVSHGIYSLKGTGEPLEICEVGVEGRAPLCPPLESEKARRINPAVYDSNRSIVEIQHEAAEHFAELVEFSKDSSISAEYKRDGWARFLEHYGKSGFRLHEAEEAFVYWNSSASEQQAPSTGLGSSSDETLIEFSNNPEPRCPCILAVDISSSMFGERQQALNEGLAILAKDIRRDPIAAMRVELAIVTFADKAEVAQDFISAGRFEPAKLEVYGSQTSMGAGVTLALDLIDKRKKTYRRAGVPYYRPWFFLITDGKPTDKWVEPASRVLSEISKRKLFFFPIAAPGANTMILQQFTGKTPYILDGLKFRELFLWLSRSSKSLSRSQVTSETQFPTPDWTASDPKKLMT